MFHAFRIGFIIIFLPNALLKKINSLCTRVRTHGVHDQDKTTSHYVPIYIFTYVCMYSL